ncbi:unnamed protein product [Aphanomyces euteiches]|uniref:DAGKc domain-containing protein n=1 Tax=Aphanomyces euteiches TaxID=100861 RepID=A0A6G0XXJ5_9STRA|nr:hypothetical protein Ae201684_000313 [Aphanomyces euteiches]KAH9091688.1 hypothetical protein Ae201684P_011232 [Aphanomyces euteiches]KAH9139213.1 hypothetical protein AeRB84_016513 [Aphanomyces euteiches]
MEGTLTCSHFTLSHRPAVLTALLEGLKIEVPTKPNLGVLLRWEDVLGANNTRSLQVLAVEDGIPLVIHTLVKARNGKRKVGSIVLEVSQSVHQNNIDDWIKIITYFADPLRPALTELPTLDTITENQPKKRNFMVLINPASGRGQGEKLFKKVEPFFVNANIDVTKVLTQRAGHATEVATTLDRSKYDAVVTVGGDGICYEFIQGLMKRLDWANAIQTPLSVLPAGGGNGLAKSVADNAGEVLTFENSAYLAVKGRPKPLDLATVRNKTSVSYIFLSLSWAFIAEMDKDSEKYRFMGAQRFTVAAVAKIMSGKHWSGTFSYIEAREDEAVPSYWESEAASADATAPQLSLLSAAVDSPKPESWKSIQGDFSMFWALNVAWPAADANFAPTAKLDDGHFHIVYIPGKATKGEFFNVLTSMDTGSHIEKPCVRVVKTRAFELQVPETDLIMVDGEAYQGGLCQVEVHRGLMRILST